MLKLTLHTNVSVANQFRTRFTVNDAKLQTLVDKLNRQVKVSVKDCYGVLGINRVTVRNRLTLHEAKKQVYWSVILPVHEKLLYVMNGRADHTEDGWRLMPLAMSVFDTSKRTSNNSQFSIYPAMSSGLITPAAVLSHLDDSDRLGWHNTPRLVNQRTNRGEQFVFNLVNQVQTQPTVSLDILAELVVGPRHMGPELDDLGLEGTPLSLMNPTELGHGELPTLLAAYFEVQTNPRWMDIRSLSDNLKWNGSLSTPYRAVDDEHYLSVVQSLAPLVAAAQKGII